MCDTCAHVREIIGREASPRLATPPDSRPASKALFLVGKMLLLEIRNISAHQLHGHGMQTERACCSTREGSQAGSCARPPWTFALRQLISQSCAIAVNKIVCGRTDQCDMLTTIGRTVHPRGGRARVHEHHQHTLPHIHPSGKVPFHASWLLQHHKAAGCRSVGVRLLLTP